MSAENDMDKTCCTINMLAQESTNSCCKVHNKIDITELKLTDMGK